MFKLFITLVIILILLFPIKIKLSLFFDGNNFEIKLFKFNILKMNISELLLKVKNLNSKDKKTKNEKKSKKKTVYLLKHLDIKKINLINNFIDNKYKPKLIIYNDISYSLCDAAITAIVYGLISAVFYSFFATINLFFNLKINYNKITPIFEDKNSISFFNKSIIKVNLVQIIIMIVIIIKNTRFKGGTQKGNTYGK
ncbi:DUF2953 domain-containing protein [Clostridium massiliamazoniense]|uniref:DUF2953 domain-containing protein n=1 Tax=Clostridium massiliamazoniense TaxID=1347366 RepID=UPI0006D7C7F1|nr:DUF2953 domain-containing protein [Clostridium massiliamazoniense]